MKTTLTITLALLSSVGAWSVHGEEAAGGHYVPGATSDFIDTLPGKPAFVLGDAFTYYAGSASLSQPILFGGVPVFGAHATTYANTLFGIDQTPIQLLGGNYAVAIAIPYIWMEVKGQVPVGTTRVNVRQTDNGVGDITLYPFMLGWTNGDFKYDTRLGIYAPSGNYVAGDLANVGRHYWTFEPATSLSWLSRTLGTEATVFAGFDVNTRNGAIDYQSGASFHLDGTLAQHLPLFGGFAGLGANGFIYQQITGDSGSGAVLGGFVGRTVGIGPVLSYVHKIGTADFAAEVKWLPELDVQKRLKGDYVWAKVSLVF